MPVAITLGIVGLCFVIGWVASYGSRPYVGVVGLGFIMAAAIPLIQQVPTRYGVIGATVLVFCWGLVLMVIHIKQRLAQLREESAAREEAFMEVFQAAERQRSSPEQSPPEESPPTGEQGTAP